MRLERFRQFDGIGLLTGFPAICALVIGLLQGERLDWFESPLICLLLGSGSLLLGLFLVNEWSHPLPFFRLQLLKRRNLTFALITLAGVLVVLGASMGVPTEFLAEIRGYRPCRAYPWCCWWPFRSSSRCRWWRPSATSRGSTAAGCWPAACACAPVPV